MQQDVCGEREIFWLAMLHAVKEERLVSLTPQGGAENGWCSVAA